MSKPYKYEGPLTGNRVTDNPSTPVVPVEPRQSDPPTCGQHERDKQMLEAVENTEIIYYGPHPCDLCDNGSIVRGSQEQGYGHLRFEYPAIAYPNHNWVEHRCEGESLAAAPPQVPSPEPHTEFLTLKDFPRKFREIARSLAQAKDCDHSLEVHAMADMLQASIESSPAGSEVSREPISAELLELLRQILPATTQMPHHGIFCKAGKKGLDPTKDSPQCTCAHSSFEAIQRAEEILRDSD